MAAPTSRSSTKRSSSTKSSARRKPAARKAGNQTRASSNGTKRSSGSRSTGAPKRSPSQSPASRNNGSGVLDTVKGAAGKAAGPAVAIGAAAVGIAGGIALKSGSRRKTVLGVKVPKSIGKSLTDIDAKSIAKSVGNASKQFAKTAKGVSKDLERAGDQAERIGKILG